MLVFKSSKNAISLWTIGFLICFSAMAGCTKTEKKIEGTIDLSPSLQKSLKPEAVLYIIARNEGTSGGPPVAVKRFTQPLIFPLTFELSSQDAMIPNTPFEGKLKVTARIAQSGSAIPILPGDIEGDSLTGAVSMGEKNLKILLNRTRSK